MSQCKPVSDVVSPPVKIEGSLTFSFFLNGWSSIISELVHRVRLPSSKFTCSGQYLLYISDVSMPLIKPSCFSARLAVADMYSIRKVGFFVNSQATLKAINLDFPWSLGKSRS